MYNENDLKTFWYAFKGGMRKSDIIQMMGITDAESESLLKAAQEKFGAPVKVNPPDQKRKSYLHQRAFKENPKQPLIRPAAKYDNKSAEERINELLGSEI